MVAKAAVISTVDDHQQAAEASITAATPIGELAAGWIHRHQARVVSRQADVLADRDPEPLHQMRVSFRKLRSTLEQFGPALVLPDRVEPERVARMGRQLGLTRDLDVLRLRLESQLMPLLPDKEVAALKKPLKQLRRERRLAFEELVEVLQGRRYLRLLADLQQWLKRPSFTPIGHEPIGRWPAEWQQPVLVGLLLLPGWWVSSPFDPHGVSDLHRLRRRIKRARYGLTNLEPLAPSLFAPWIARFACMQDLLGDLNDLQLLQQALNDHYEDEADQVLPTLCSLLTEQRSQAWMRWTDLAEELRSPKGRRAFQGLLLGEPT